ncbi:Outer membrane porin F precursor [compost metagenome]
MLIEGHTDGVGGRDFNQDLSELRALSVMKALVDRGVSKTRIKALGYGMSRPLADNATEAGRQMNRRTDIIILGERQENLGQDPFKGMIDSVVSFGKDLFK